MTTLIYDSNTHIIVSDSRWSEVIIHDDKKLGLAYIDQFGYNKIFTTSNLVVALSDHIRDCIAFRDICADPLNMTDKLEGLKAVGFMITRNNGLNHFMIGDGCIHEAGVYFQGSGKQIAYENWKICKDIFKALELTKNNDPQTGGQTRFMKIKTGENNIIKDTTFKLSEDITGIIMVKLYDKDGQLQKEIPLHECADQIRESIHQKLKEYTGLFSNSPENPAPFHFTKQQKELLRKIFKDDFDMDIK